MTNMLVDSVVGILRVIMTFTRPISDGILNAAFRLVYGKPKKIPPITNPILLLSACELAKKIRRRELSCEEVMRAYVLRIHEVQPMINAVVDERFDEAIKEAKAVDRFLASGAKSESEIAKETPFLGVPFTCKEAVGVKGMSQTCGYPLRRGVIAEADSDVVEKYRKAGAIPYVVSNVPEFCMWWESANHIFGITNNPYDPIRTVGGSSGGEGAIIAAGGAAIGIGSDIAGSIRIPASFCGIYGHKPTAAIVSNKGMWPTEASFDNFVSVGPMCRYAEDMLPIMKAIVKDEKRLKLDEKVDFRKVKVYYLESLKGILKSATSDIQKSVKKAARHFQDKFGCKVEKLYLKELEDSFSIWECKLLEVDGPEFKSVMADRNGRVSLFMELLKNMLGRSDHTLPAIYFAIVEKRDKDDEYTAALQKFKALEKRFNDLFKEDAIFLFPTHREPPVHHHTTIPKYFNIGYTAVFNVLGLPASQIPTGFSGGLPIGIQAISGKFKDHLCMAAAVELDKVFGGWKSPVPIDLRLKNSNHNK